MEFYPKLKLIRTNLIVKWKKRRKLNMIVNMIEAVLNERKWKFKEGRIANLINKKNLEEMFL
jgi:hypothetical protein